MSVEDFKPGIYTVISDDNADIRCEPRIIDGVSTNVVGQHTPGTQVKVYEVFVDKHFMVWGRISAVHQGTGKANWMCIHTDSRMPHRPTPKPIRKTLKVMIGDTVVFETPLN